MESITTILQIRKAKLNGSKHASVEMKMRFLPVLDKLELSNVQIFFLINDNFFQYFWGRFCFNFSKYTFLRWRLNWKCILANITQKKNCVCLVGRLMALTKRGRETFIRKKAELGVALSSYFWTMKRKNNQIYIENTATSTLKWLTFGCVAFFDWVTMEACSAGFFGSPRKVLELKCHNVSYFPFLSPTFPQKFKNNNYKRLKKWGWERTVYRVGSGSLI